MDKPDRTAAPERDEDVRDAPLDTGHPVWIRVVTLVVLAVFVLATLVAALA